MKEGVEENIHVAEGFNNSIKERIGTISRNQVEAIRAKFKRNYF